MTLTLKDLIKLRSKKSEKQEATEKVVPNVKLSYCFVAIAHNDPPELANSIRHECEVIHERDNRREFRLYDIPRKKVVYYSYGERIEKNLQEAGTENLRHALTVMNSVDNREQRWAIKNKYDYVMIKMAIDKGMVEGLNNLQFNTTNNFISYIKNLGFTNLPGKASFNKYYNKINGRFPWTYTGLEVDSQETERRNAIVQKFIELVYS